MEVSHNSPSTPLRPRFNHEGQNLKKRSSPQGDGNKKKQKSLGKENKLPSFPVFDTPLAGNSAEINLVKNGSVMEIEEPSILAPIQQKKTSSNVENTLSYDLDELKTKLAEIRNKLNLLREKNNASFNHIMDNSKLEMDEFEHLLSEDGIDYISDAYEPEVITKVIKELDDLIQPVKESNVNEQELNFLNNKKNYKKIKKLISKNLQEKRLSDFFNQIEASITMDFKNKLYVLINKFGRHAGTNFETPSTNRAKDVDVSSPVSKMKPYANAYQLLIDAVKEPMEASYNSPQARAMFVLFYVIETKPLEECNQSTATTFNEILNQIPIE